MNRSQVYRLIDGERAYQDKRWNNKTTLSAGQHSPEEWISYMEVYLNEAKTFSAHHSVQEALPVVMDIIRKVTAMGVAAMEQHDTPKRKE